jgi:thiamine-phosphate pyrophosphorylase
MPSKAGTSAGASHGRSQVQAVGCRIYAVVAAGPNAPAHLEVALAQTGTAALLLTTLPGTLLDHGAAGPLIAAAQRAGVAALVGDVDLVHALDADGVHLGAGGGMVHRYAEARRRLGAAAIVGADCGISRHDAMELADAGADYIAFGAPRHLQDRAKGVARRDGLVAWWGEIFEVPCVACDVESATEAAALAAAGADFVGVRLDGSPPDAAARLLAEIGAALPPAVK